MGFESIVKRINSLPPLPESLIKLEELYAKGGVPDPKELVKIIEADPVLTANILVYVNVPFYGFSRRIVSIFQAVVLFGATTIRGFALSSFVKNTFKFNMEPYCINTKTFQQVSALQSSLMFQWYMRVDIQKANILIPVSFLLEIGKIVVANEIAENLDTEKFCREIKEEDNIAEVEKRFVGISSIKVAALLFEHWNFSDLFIKSMYYLDNPSLMTEEYLPLVRALDIVQTCVNIKEIATENSIEKARKKVQEYNLSLEIFDRTIQRWRRALED